MLAAEHFGHLLDGKAMGRGLDLGGLIDFNERSRIADRRGELWRRTQAACDIGHGLSRCCWRRRAFAFLRTTGRFVHRDEEVIPLLTHVTFSVAQGKVTTIAQRRSRVGSGSGTPDCARDLQIQDRVRKPRPSNHSTIERPMQPPAALLLAQGRWLVLPRHTQPEKDVQAVLDHIQITLPAQPPPRIKASQVALLTSPEAADPPSLW